MQYLETTPATDITDYVLHLERMTNNGLPDINTAAIVLDGDGGAFQTNSNGGKTPILLNDFDRFKITYTKNGKTYSRQFELDVDLFQKVPSGNADPIELLGREHSMDKIPCPASLFFLSYHDAIERVLKIYRDQRGTKQPFISTTFTNPPVIQFLNEAPKNIFGVFDFTDEPSCLEALRRIQAMMNLDVARLGTGDLYAMVFEDNSAFPDQMLLKVFSRGKLPATPTTIKDTPTTPVYQITKRKEGKTGTRILVEGEPDTGMMPENPHRFSSLIEVFNQHPEYDPAQDYAKFVRVQKTNIHYEAISYVPVGIAPPGALYWKVIEIKDVVGTYQVSPLTQDKATLFKNFASNPTNPLNTNFNSPAFIDANARIRESNRWRDFVLIRSNTDKLNSNPTLKRYLYNQDAGGDGVYNGLMMLVDTSLGAPAGSFALNGGKDRFGRNFANAFVIRVGSEWIVAREPQIGDQICVRQEGKIYEWNVPVQDQTLRPGSDKRRNRKRSGGTVIVVPGGSLAWRDVSDTFLGNDAFHYPSSIQNVSGLFPITAAPSGNYNDNSAVEITYTYTMDPLLSQFLASMTEIADAFIPGNFIDESLILNIYNAGWWMNFGTLFPENTLNGIGEDIGDLLGGPYETRNEGCLLDTNNVNLTRDGKVGRNTAKGNELGNLTGIRFNFQFEVKQGGNTAAFKGNIPFSIFAYDLEGNVWKAPTTYRIHGDIQEISALWTQFKLHKARTPWGLDTLLSNIVVPELEFKELFEQRKIKMFGMQLEQSYDSEGRYQPFNWDNLVNSIFSTGGVVSFVGRFDLLGFIKAPNASTPVETTRLLQPKKIIASKTRNLIQLESIAYAEKDLRGIQYEGYTIEKEPSIDFGPDEGFYLEDSKMINDADNGMNTRKLFCQNMYYQANDSGEKQVILGVVRP